MLCDELLELIEPLAAGDLAPDARMGAHLASCVGCRAALDRAHEIERLLHDRPAPAAPPQFTSRVLARIRRDQWRRDQLLDAGFNTAVVSLVLAVVVALWLAVDRAGIATLSSGVTDIIYMISMTVIRRIAPAVPLYVAATALIAAAVGLWWWAERDLTL